MKCVYVIKCQQYYKIGYGSLNSRIFSFATGNPFELIPVIEVPMLNARSVEFELHKKYADKNVRGEWFELSEDDLKDIFGYLRYHDYSQAPVSNRKWED